MRWEIDNVTEALMTKVLELTECTKKCIRLSALINQVVQKLQSLVTSLLNLRIQLDMHSLGHLLPSIVDPSNLKDYLKVRAKLPHHLRLPTDPTVELRYFYNSLYLQLIENDKLLIPVSLLDTGIVLEMF